MKSQSTAANPLRPDFLELTDKRFQIARLRHWGTRRTASLPMGRRWRMARREVVQPLNNSQLRGFEMSWVIHGQRLPRYRSGGIGLCLASPVSREFYHRFHEFLHGGRFMVMITWENWLKLLVRQMKLPASGFWRKFQCSQTEPLFDADNQIRKRSPSRVKDIMKLYRVSCELTKRLLSRTTGKISNQSKIQYCLEVYIWLLPTLQDTVFLRQWCRFRSFG